MKKILFLFAAYALLPVLSTPARADVDRVGAGFILGEPTGVNVKLMLVKGTAIDMAAAWTLSGNNELQLHGDYLYHRYDVFQARKGRVPLFFGFGGRVRFVENADNLVGLRFPVGVGYEFADAPFDVFFELVPILDIAPDSNFDLEAAVGGRFWF